MFKKKWMKKGLAITVATSCFLLSACGGEMEKQSETAQNQSNGEAANTDFEGKSIEVATYLSGDTLTAYKKVIEEFENETGVEVVLDEYGNDYDEYDENENGIKQPFGYFETHGWSLIRYKEYLMDLSQEAWADD